MRCDGAYKVRVELCCGAMRYVTDAEALELLAPGSSRFELCEQEGRVSVIREVQPDGWVQPPPDPRPARFFETDSRERRMAKAQLEKDLG